MQKRASGIQRRFDNDDLERVGLGGQIAVMHRIVVEERRWISKPASCMR